MLALFLLLAGIALPADDGAEAYRRGDYPTAQTRWTEALASADLAAEKARLTYNLGNASYRAGDLLEAVGWYTRSLRLAPRDEDAWANLELARAGAGLEPADRGDLADTTRRVLNSVTLEESEWFALLGLALLALVLTGEALRGGRVWRRSAFAALALALLAFVPLAYQHLRAGGHPMLCVEADGTGARSEPRPDAKRVEDLEAGTVVDRLDALPGWVKVRTDAGRELWVRERALFDLAG